MLADTFSGQALSWLLTYGLHSTLLLCLAWLASTRLAADSQRARELLWRAALLGGLLTATAQVAIGHEPWLGRFALAPQPAPEPSFAEPALRSEAELAPALALLELSKEDGFAAQSAPAPLAAQSPFQPALEAAAEPALAQPDFEHPARGPSFGSSAPRLELGAGGLQLDLGFSGGPLEGLAGTSAVQASEAPAQLARASESRFGWPAVLLAVWIFGAAIGLARLALALRALREGLAERFALEAGPLARTLSELRREAGLRRRVRLSCAPGLAAPVALGWLRPEICVPLRAATDLSPEQQRGMLAHELAHLVRRDPLWLLACRALEGLLFFQPLNRLARRELQETAEYLCDDWAAARSGGGLALASCLAEVAGWFAQGSAPRTPALAAGMASRPSALSARIERLLASQPCARSARWVVPAIALLLAGVAAAAPGAGAKQSETERDAALERELAALAAEADVPLAQREDLEDEELAEREMVDELAAEPADALEAELDELAAQPRAVHPQVEVAIADWLARNNALPAPSSERERAAWIEQLAQGQSALIERLAQNPASLAERLAQSSTSLAERLAPALATLDAEIAGLECELAEAEQLAQRRGLAPALRARLESVERALDVLHDRRERLDELLERRDARAHALAAR